MSRHLVVLLALPLLLVGVRGLPEKPGDPCDEATAPCKTGTELVCRREMCRCSHARMQAFPNGKCIAVIEGASTCSPGQDDGCPQNAYCGKDGVCRCVPGTSPYIWDSSYGPICQFDYGRVCTDDDPNGNCNADKRLACIQGKCRCADDPDAAWDPDQGTCAGVERTHCNYVDGSFNMASARDRFLLLGRMKYGIGLDLPCFTGLDCVPNGNLFGICRNKSSTDDRVMRRN